MRTLDTSAPSSAPKILAGVMLIAMALIVSARGAAASDACLYLEPANLHLTPGQTSSAPLRLLDSRGKRVTGAISYHFSDRLLSIDSSGFVTAIKKERRREIGDWVWAEHPDQGWTANSSVVRVLGEDYGLRFKTVSRKNIALHFPTALPNSPANSIPRWVKKQQMLKILEYSYRKMSDLMMLRPFGGCRQYFEVDIGNTEVNRVCGINGNPVRLGWNIEGDETHNCFIYDSDAPQWGVILHELAHNFSLGSPVFYQGLLGDYDGSWIFSEHGAQVLSWVVMQMAIEELGLNATASRALPRINAFEQGVERQYFDEWVRRGAKHRAMGSAEVNIIWMNLLHEHGPGFARDYFYLLAPHHYTRLETVIRQVGEKGARGGHTFFAALVSAASGESKYRQLKKIYHFKMEKTLFNKARRTMNEILQDRPQSSLAEKTTIAGPIGDGPTCTFERRPALGSLREAD